MQPTGILETAKAIKPLKDLLKFGRGDFQVLAERGRRALRVHLGKDVNAGLAALSRAVKEALS